MGDLPRSDSSRHPSPATAEPDDDFGERFRQLSEASRREADRLLSAEEIEEELARRRSGA